MILSDRHRYPAVLAVIALMVLLIGYWLKPVPKRLATTPEKLSVTRAEVESLQQLVRRNNLRSLSASFSNVADDTIASLVVVQPWGVDGVLLPDLGLVVAKSLSGPPRPLFISASSTQPLTPTLWVPGLPFLTSQFVTNAAVSPARTSDSTPSQGGWVMVVANGVFGQTLFSPGIYNGVVEESCGPYIRYRFLTTVPLNASHTGGGLFDLSGNLHGLVLPCDDGPAVIPTSEVRRAIVAVDTPEGRVLARYGIRLGKATTTDTPSVAVTEVWNGWSGDTAGFQPGDRLTSIGGQPVSTQESALALLVSSDVHEVRVLRRKRTMRMNLPLTSPDSALGSGPAITLEDGNGVTVAAVADDSSAIKAGMRVNDRILFIDGIKATGGAVQRILGKPRVSKSVQIVVQRPGRRLLLVVQP